MGWTGMGAGEEMVVVCELVTTYGFQAAQCAWLMEIFLERRIGKAAGSMYIWGKKLVGALLSPSFLRCRRVPALRGFYFQFFVNFYKLLKNLKIK
jgi:hypothetical protein